MGARAGAATRAGRPGESLIGRQTELRQVLELLQRTGMRLLTVSGPGGVGKTMLVEEAVRRFAAVDRVWVQTVPLHGGARAVAVEQASEALAGTAASTVPAPSTPPSGRRRLVILDGVDAAPGIIPVVRAALDADVDLMVVTTSIGPLGLHDEHLVRLEPLRLPDREDDDLVQASSSPAVHLFCDRLSSADPDFALTPENAATVVELCREVDGLPLALELAAGRCATLGVAPMLDLARQDPAAVLGPTPGPAGKRHGSLRATIQWSYSLLAASEQYLFRALGVFTGPFSWDALVAIARAGHRREEAGAAAELADGLSTLVTAGLVKRVKSDDPQHAGRYVLPPAVRAFASERAAAGGEVDKLRQRHNDYYRDLARSAAARHSWSFGAGGDAGELLADQRELLAALKVVEDEHRLTATLSFAVDLEPLWMGIGAASGANRLGALLAFTENAEGDAQESAEVPDELVAAALVSLVTLTLWCRNPTLGETLHDQLTRASGLARRAQRPDIELRAMQIEIQLLVIEQDPDSASAIARKAQEIAVELGTDWWHMRFLHWSAIAANASGDYAGALDDALAARDLARAADDEHQLLWTNHVLRGIPGAADDPRSGLPSDQGLLDLARRLGDVQAEGMILLHSAFRSGLRGQVAQAAAHVGAALELTGRTGYWYLEELSLFVLVLITTLAGEAERAAELHGALSRALPSVHSWLPRPAIAAYDAAISSVRSSLGEAHFEQLAADGQLLGWHVALRRADALASTVAARHHQTAPHERADQTVPSHCRSAEAGDLSPRELEVLHHMAAGCANKEIAGALGLRPKTVMHQAANIYRKLGVHSRTQAVNAASRLGLLDDSPRQ